MVQRNRSSHTLKTAETIELDGPPYKGNQSPGISIHKLMPIKIIILID